MPRVYRIMRVDSSGRPEIGSSASSLGVRRGKDVTILEDGTVVANGKGMSVSPTWRDCPISLIPDRLKDPRARGGQNRRCFTMGTGPFIEGEMSPGLILVPDTPVHGNIAPVASMPFEQYEANIYNTRDSWTIDEA